MNYSLEPGDIVTLSQHNTTLCVGLTEEFMGIDKIAVVWSWHFSDTLPRVVLNNANDMYVLTGDEKNLFLGDLYELLY